MFKLAVIAILTGIFLLAVDKSFEAAFAFLAGLFLAFFAE